jgi:hypothetical protein
MSRARGRAGRRDRRGPTRGWWRRGRRSRRLEYRNNGVRGLIAPWGRGQEGRHDREHDTGGCESTDTTSGEQPDLPPPELTAAEQDAIRELVRQARASGTALTGPGGLLKQLTKMVVEAALG